MVGPRGTAAVTRTLTGLGPRGRECAARIARNAPSEGKLDSSYDGMTVELDLGDNLQQELYYLGSYEAPLVAFLLAELKPDDTFIDVGAHIGTFALPVARRLLNGRVFAFEPAPDTAALLERAAGRNGLRSLTVIRAALGDRTGSTTLRSSVDFGVRDAGVRSLHGEGEALFEVPVIRLDDWADEHGLESLAAVKIDVEGNEVAALRGMSGCLETHRPRLVVVEVIRSLLERAGTSYAEFADVVSEAGYVPMGTTLADIVAGIPPRDPAAVFGSNVVLRPAETV